MFCMKSAAANEMARYAVYLRNNAIAEIRCRRIYRRVLQGHLWPSTQSVIALDTKLQKVYW